LVRERLTGLLMCSSTSGRPTRPCLDPWPDVFDFKVKPDRSIEPPAEPLPARWLLDDIFSAATYNPIGNGTTADYANAPKPATDDATRLQHFLTLNFQSKSTTDFVSYQNSLNQNQNRASVVTINPADYDGTFIPSSSVRTVTPPNEATELADVGKEPASGDEYAAAPWAAQKGI
jgi:hypothetical protein